MAVIDLRGAIGKGLREALTNNDKVFIMGEDVGEYGGAYSVTRGLLKEFGPERVMDTPISESVIVGAGIGSALAGLRPIVEIMTINFSLLAMDQIVNHAAKLRYMSNGQFTVPLLIRTVTGGGAQLAATHSQSFEGWYASVPGLKVIVPSTPYDALGLIRSALKEDNPVIMAEHALLYSERGEVPDEWYEIPIGKASSKNDISIENPNDVSTELNCSIPKSAYLKNPKTPKCPTRLIIKKIFLDFKLELAAIILPM